jgi:tetratricopeptide (TPR) repeat protein
MKKLLKAALLTIPILFALTGLATSQASDCGSKDYACKVDNLSKKIVADPNDGENYYSRGVAYEELKQYDRAIPDFTKYIASNPANKEYLADGYNERANCYRFSGSFAKALADYNIALQLFESSKVYVSRGNYYSDQKEFAKAVADYDRALALNNKEAEAYYNRAKAYNGQKLYAKAIADLDIYVGLNKTDIPFLADGYQERSTAYRYLGKLTLALADMNSAIGLDETTGRRFTARALIYRAMGKTSLAVADEKTAESLKK